MDRKCPVSLRWSLSCPSGPNQVFDTKLAYSSLGTFGYAWWPNLSSYNTHKLTFRSNQCPFLGYSTHHKGYKCLDICTSRDYISHDVVFDKSMFPFSTLHPNIGVSLSSEFSLLPSSILESTSYGGGSMEDNDHMPKSTYASMQPCPLHDATRMSSTMDHSVLLPGNSYLIF
jgi:hypothetical protein